jgi:hypothetical protein
MQRSRFLWRWFYKVQVLKITIYVNLINNKSLASSSVEYLQLLFKDGINVKIFIFSQEIVPT